MKKFKEALSTTAAGMRLRLAWREGQIALQQLQLLATKRDESVLNRWRRAYIQACERASAAIGELSDGHDWPMEAECLESYTYTPARRERRLRFRRAR